MIKSLIAAAAWTLGALCAPMPAVAACAGDCSGDGNVTVDELIVGVGIALGSTPIDLCKPVDADSDGQVTIDEIVGAVDAALGNCSPPPPRLIALSRGGRIASLDLAPPWTVRKTGDLGAAIASARCRAGRCLVVHPSIDSISVVDATDLSVADPIVLERGADPRDVAFVGDHTVVVSQYGRGSSRTRSSARAPRLTSTSSAAAPHLTRTTPSPTSTSTTWRWIASKICCSSPIPALRDR